MLLQFRHEQVSIPLQSFGIRGHIGNAEQVNESTQNLCLVLYPPLMRSRYRILRT